MKFSIASLLPLALTLNVSLAFAAPYCHPCPYSCRDLGLGNRDCEEIESARGLCCLDLSRSGRELTLEQERVENTRPSSVPDARGANAIERCPSGFRPSEQKCSVEERRRGCKDMRLPGGLGCVKR